MNVSTLPWRLSTMNLFLFSLLAAPFVQAAASVNVALKSSFPAAPYLIELLETAASENSTSYFPLLDRIAEGAFSDLTTEQELYNRFTDVLQQDGHIRNAESLSSFKFALSLHAAAPRVEAHLQYYNTSVSPRLMVAQDAACPVWVHFDGQQYCSPSLERAQQPVHADASDSPLPFDRILGSDPDAPASILYADITHPLFGQFHSTISETARAGKTTYRVRYRVSSAVDTKPLYVGGYGVELVLKRTDYIVIDDRDASKLQEPEQASLDNFDDEDTADVRPLTTSELLNLGVNAASFIASNSDPADALLQVSANFPKYASRLASQNASNEFLAEHRANRERLLPSGFNVFWANGLQIENRQINAYSLLNHLRRERKIIQQMNDIGLSAAEAVSIMSHEVVAQSQADDTTQRFDWRDEIEGNRVILWMNDIEQDKRYVGWPTQLRALFQRSYPGQLPSVARDIHNVIVPIDLGNIKDIELVANTLQSLVKRLVPIRIGLVPMGGGPIAETYAKSSYYLLEKYGLSTLLAFYQDIVLTKKITSNAEKHLEAAIKNRKPRKENDILSYEDMLSNEDISHRLMERDAYLKRLDLQGPNPPFVANGVVMPRSETWFELMSSRVFMDLQMVQQAVYQEAILEDSWVPHFFLFQSVARRNAFVVPHDPKDIKIIDVGSLVTEFEDTFNKLPLVCGADAALLSDRAHLLVVADLDSDDGKTLLSAALELRFLKPEVEILILHNGDGETQVSSFSAQLYDILRGQGRNIQADLVVRLQSALDGSGPLAEVQPEVLEEARRYWSAAQDVVQALGFSQSQSVLWLSGRVIGPLNTQFTVEDLQLLLEYEKVGRIAPVTTAITGLGLEDRFTVALDLAKVTSLVARSLKSDLPEGMRESAPLIRMDRFKVWNDTNTAIKLSNSPGASIDVVAVVDPASELGQSWVPILQTLSELDGINVKIFLNPKERLTELPVKRFYRQVLSAAPSFDADGAILKPQAAFHGVPKDTLFNLGMVVPPSWLVAPKESVFDLDNIKLSGTVAEQDIEALYELEHILIEGHARDVTTGPPPRGVQLLLGTEQNPHFTDTIVMANLGYFQFKANPGQWQISLKPGRSSKIFNIDSVGPNGYAAEPGDETTSVALLDFQGQTLFPRLSRKPGMEEEDVLESSVLGGAMDYLNKGASFASSALSSLGLKTSKPVNADINIFSVASGHLYERMLNIMMLSVMKHTKHAVKFWFIEQFLSPSFKETLPYLASHYGFDYEMVTYKWPHWLRGQREKQREIWGYKILFLDVLFPLSLDKVIFVDADQIVRTDMMELNKVDLHGAAYGFTPMCDSRTEMEGFRFWKQGYWETFLRGKPYHISALYVVDLKKFREVAAGDRLRQQYQALSADPASLSNLDQDLPNHMQHSLPIHSLSQEWLWCETWCSDESLGVAKTIDLCNNPLTKEPKLDRARRQVPEWTVYDDEIAAVIEAAMRPSIAADVRQSNGDGKQKVVTEPKPSRKDEL